MCPPAGDETATQAASARGTATLRVRGVSIEVTSGPDAGRREVVAGVSFVIGSGEAADLRLTDGTVSREHVRMTLTPDGVRIRDEGSKNGTWIGGLRVSDVLLTTDSAIVVGASTIALRLEAI